MSEQIFPESSSPSAPNPAVPIESARGRRRYGGYTSYGGYGGFDGNDEGVGGPEAHLMDYVRTVYRHRRIALTTFTVLFLVVAVNTFSTTPVFEGRVQLLLDPTKPNVTRFEEISQPDYFTQQYFYQTQYTILKSRGLARRTIDALKLWDSPEFGGGNTQK